MQDQNKSRRQLIVEVASLRERVDELESSQFQINHAAEVVHEGREFYRQLVNLSPIGICALVGGRLYFANEALAAILGISSVNELLGREAIDFVDPECRNAFKELLRKQQKGGAPSFDGSLKLVRRDGSSVDAEVGLASITYHQHQATELLIRDITELKRVRQRREELERLVAQRTAELAKQNKKLLEEAAEHARSREALQEAEERFRAIFQSVPDLIFTKDRSRRYTMVNPAMERLHGLPAAKMTGRRPEEVMNKESAGRIRQVDLRVLDGETVEEQYTTVIRGAPMSFHGIRVPLRDAHGKVTGICGIVRNTTEQWQALRPSPEPVEVAYLSQAMRSTLTLAGKATKSNGNVLLLGESGCGKDHLARWIHERSGRSRGPYFAINCAAVAKELADSELFGHQRGAFTGARESKKGLLQLAEGGTLLLNEVGELPLAQQAKLLTFLDTKSFLRVGGQEHIHVDARLMAATHRDLHKEVQEGRFLAALFYRLNVLTITVPPLRDRVEDVPILAKEIMSRLASEMQLPVAPTLDPRTLRALTQYDWPGNVRELRNVLERALMLWEGESLNLNVPMSESRRSRWSHNVNFPADRSLHELTDEFRQAFCEEALRRSGGRKKDAADLLRISRGALYRYMKQSPGAREVETQS